MSMEWDNSQDAYQGKRPRRRLLLLVLVIIFIAAVGYSLGQWAGGHT